LKFLSNKSTLFGALALMSFMFVVVMFFVNPLIDSGNGMSVILLQLAFDKSTGIEIIKHWGSTGIINFNKWIFTDYIYAFSYSLFFASILSFFIAKNNTLLLYKWIIYLPFIVGFFDCLENTIELLFIKNPLEFSSLLFFIHSILASLKWLSLPGIVVAIFILYKKSSAHQ
jgi:hypothetical protein